jgi:hypothetical protein
MRGCSILSVEARTRLRRGCAREEEIEVKARRKTIESRCGVGFFVNTPGQDPTVTCVVPASQVSPPLGRVGKQRIAMQWPCHRARDLPS